MSSRAASELEARRFWAAMQKRPAWALCTVWLNFIGERWFRYFGPGPLDQLLRRLIPPENTATGRCSLEYIRRMRAELGMPPP